VDNPKYSASLSQTQGRSGFSVIFRHPTRRDPATGKPGIRVRRGLGTRDYAEAERLRDELNVLMGDPKYHDRAARAEAERRFDPRVVDIFFDKMVPEDTDFLALREAVIPLPESRPDGYRRVLFLGTTGAGKTTLVRQLIGTDPFKERFPSTSTAKTTIHDTEIVLGEGDWRAVATFVSSDEVREYLSECISAAVLAAAKGADDAEVLRRLLNHVSQRFRFSYVLGTGPAVASRSSDFDDDEEEPEGEADLFSQEEHDAVDVTGTRGLLAKTVESLRQLASRLGNGLRAELDVHGDDDERVADELFEEELDNLLRDDEEFHQAADALMEEIEKRFDLLPPGKVQKTRQGWPLSWSGEWPREKRAEFLRAVSRFSSNYAPLFGRLLTPLVNGVRVAGPFTPAWDGSEVPKLVLLDGEGLGHTPKSSSAVSTAVSRRIEAADAVLLVDSATQPMQAAPLAAMREIVATGNARKLLIAFTHFDEVKGDNLPNASAKVQHVLASAENVLAAFGEELGPYAERALRQRLERARFFFADIHEPLSGAAAAGRRTISQLSKLLEALDAVIERPELAEARPVYDRMNLVLAIRSAADAFHAAWRPLLGLEFKPGFVKEHWTRIKALSRRLATGWADEYDDLTPVADLRKELRDRIYVFVQNPLRWEGPEPADDQKQACFDAFADNLGRRLLEVCTRRVWHERAGQWQDAYDKHGTGSTFVRARIIGDEIYEPAAPVPDVTPSPDRNQFLHEVIAEVEKAASDTGAVLK
jgi:energy-coupling factor transporter ATP-binding protein EcfA2